jgi:hypothetical protein
VMAVAMAAVLAPLGPLTVTIAAQSYRLTGITPIFDGWEELPDGSRLFYFGYINRHSETVTIPLGAANTFEPSPADRNQPTVFIPGRHEHMFTVKAPANFKGKLVWTLKSEMGVQTANASFDQLYILEERENENPNARPPSVTVKDAAGKAGQPVTLTPQVTPAQGSGQVVIEGAAAQAAGLNVTWSKHRGTGNVTFTAAPSIMSPERGAGAPVPAGRGARGRGAAVPGSFSVACGTKPAASCGAAMATFSEPGAYLLRVQARQDGMESLAFMKVTVNP